MASTKERLRALAAWLDKLQPTRTAFLVEGGVTFYTDMDPFAYLLRYGAYTPDGRRIILYPHPVEGVDGLSLSLDQMIDEAIEAGRLVLPDLESDPVNGF